MLRFDLAIATIINTAESALATMGLLESDLAIANIIETVESTLTTIVGTAGFALATMKCLAHST